MDLSAHRPPRFYEKVNTCRINPPFLWRFICCNRGSDSDKQPQPTATSAVFVHAACIKEARPIPKGKTWLNFNTRGVALGHPRPKTVEDSMEIISPVLRDVRTKTGVYLYTKLRHVKTLRAKAFGALPSPRSVRGLPTSALPEEKYKVFKEALQKDRPPS
ncbi:uncharacterized protein BJ212DRAFT_1591062 [Suillus subaureus]|uniref:Uncharacterized protein n=1 Tax=Suillus subaureus TaxID=48587 RepID=A0A9P7DVE1_9AGAM|nr:uncharacterized protein BJ212DRAFT_1591062 [Suillus subaureus]KAG1804116.1 hypothetical protein BJ212DRAFT_1591062 [Suillus subaureus]